MNSMFLAQCSLLNNDRGRSQTQIVGFTIMVSHRHLSIRTAKHGRVSLFLHPRHRTTVCPLENSLHSHFPGAGGKSRRQIERVPRILQDCSRRLQNYAWIGGVSARVRTRAVAVTPCTTARPADQQRRCLCRYPPEGPTRSSRGGAAVLFSRCHRDRLFSSSSKCEWLV